MYLKDERIKRGYRMVYLILCLAGIVLQYANSCIADVGAAQHGGNSDSTLMLNAYYTMQTNILCFIYFAVLLVLCPKHENPIIKGMVVMSIVFTGLGYWILLSGYGGAMEGNNAPFFGFSNLMVHTFTPLLAVLDYFLFTPKGEYKWWHPFTWLGIPLFYVIFVYIRAAASDKMFMGFGAGGVLQQCAYPYPFLDPNFFEAQLGNAGYIWLAIFGLMIAYLAVSYASYGVDKLCKYIGDKYALGKEKHYEEAE